MNTGLLVYSAKYAECNLGDYIQSLAARQFLERVDAFVSRESLDEYPGNDLAIILNGWFSHEPNHWPPAAAIRPLFVSFHINSVARDELMRESSIAYFREWSPVGCRDFGTAQLLRNAGVDAYFSGCLTLTLGRTWKRRPADGSIYFVDPFFEVKTDYRSIAGYVRTLFANLGVVSSIATKMFGRRDVKSLLKSSAFYKAYHRLFTDETLRTAQYLRHVLPNAALGDDASKFAAAEELLTKYASASFVVTSRIHCALPCVGIGTPVLYVEDVHQSETSWCRLEGLRELVHVIAYDDGVLRGGLTRGKITPAFTFRNKTGHIALAKELERTCEAFVRSAVDRQAAK